MQMAIWIRCGSSWQIMVLLQNKSFWLLWTQTSFWARINWDSHVFLYTILDPTGMSGKWWAVTSWWPLLWFLLVAELFLWFTATQEQITCSELGAYLNWTEHQCSFCVVDNPPFLNRVLWYCRRIIQSFSSCKLFPVQAVYIILFLHWLDGGCSFAIAPCIVQGRYMLYKSPILCNTLKRIGSELESFIRPEHIWDCCLAKSCG